MTNLENAHLQLTESQILIIKDRIKTLNTKEQFIDIMRYARLNDQASQKNSQSAFKQMLIISLYILEKVYC